MGCTKARLIQIPFIITDEFKKLTENVSKGLYITYLFISIFFISYL